MSKKNDMKQENGEDQFPGYPLYPKSEDIYNKGKEEQDIDPEDISKRKEVPKKKQYREDSDSSLYEEEMLTNLNVSGAELADEDDIINSEDEDDIIDDLDIPGAELDDEDENIGSEDEENNYYSLGGDNHNDLEEDNGDH